MKIYLNNLKINLKEFIKDKTVSLLTVLGLTLGLTSFILIYQVIVNEVSYDRFHRKSDRIYRVISDIKFGNSVINSPVTTPPLAKAMINDLSGVESATRVIEKQALIGYKNNYFNESKIAAVDSNFLQLFDFKITRGNPANALNAPGSIVISENMSVKYFAGTDPVGKELEVVSNGKKQLFSVSGVMENGPQNSSLCYDFFLPITSFPETDSGNWNSLSVNTFILLRNGIPQPEIDKKFPSLVKKYIGNNSPDFDKWLASGNKFAFNLQPLTKVHLYSKLESDYAHNGNIIIIYILGIIAFLVVTISTVNYINLSGIRLCRFEKKTGIMKILGASKSLLISGNILLSLIVSLFSLLLAVLLTEFVLPVFQNMFGKQEILVLSQFEHMVVIFLVALSIGILSGFVSSVRKPTKETTNLLAFSTSKAESTRSKKALMIFQNVLSICLIIASIVIYKQTKLLHGKDLGYNSSNLLIINNVLPVNDKLNVFKEMLMKNSNILNISVSDYVPSREVSNYFTLHFHNGQTPYDFSLSGFSADEQFLNTYQIAVSEGKFFDPLSVSGNECVMNYAAIKQFNIQDPVGKVVWWGDKEYRISGIIPDFNYESLKNEVRPLIIKKLDANPRNLFVTVRCSNEEMANTVAYVAQAWKNISGDIPFEYNFLDKNLAALYQKEKTFSQLISIFSFLSIVIACLGVFGLSSYASILRTKEIGIRKVNGAKVSEILNLLNKDYIKGIGIAIPIAIPIAYYSMHLWLESFAYKTSLSWWIFALAGLLALGIALLTVSWQSWKAATRNPVEALRYE